MIAIQNGQVVSSICIMDRNCGAMFPFDLDSNGSKSIIQYLHDNHNYKTRILHTGL